MTKPKRKELSHLPSAFIREALTDLKLCAASDKYKINMKTWHIPNGQCSVCFAGAVMAQRLGSDPKTDLTPSQFSPSPNTWGKTEVQLRALDKFRLGNVFSAFDYLREAPDDYEAIKYDAFKSGNGELFKDLNREMTSYEEDPKQFHKDMQKLANDLEEVGY